MSEIITKDWTEKTTIPFIIANEGKRGFAFKVLSKPNEPTEGIRIFMNNEDLLSALEFFKSQCQK